MATRIFAWKSSMGLDVCKDEDCHFLFTGKSRVQGAFLEFLVNIDTCPLHYISTRLPPLLISCPQDIGPEFSSETSKYLVAKQDPDTFSQS